uniref:START domain-containing protein n=1 Tax=Kalanchoe fedtschenkoi TaxID=63787 RepID=A0A7N0UJZ5_KALFE
MGSGVDFSAIWGSFLNGEVLEEVVAFMAPLWIAVAVGVLVGWVWRPKWASLSRYGDSAETVSTPLAKLGFISSLGFIKIQLSGYVPWISDDRFDGDASSADPTSESDSSKVNVNRENESQVGDDDLQHLCRLVEVKDEGPAWIPMMDKTTPTMRYQAWRRDPESGPPQYRSRTVYEDVTPELVRDFFWDDEFRKNWDDMLIHSSTLEECPVTGSMLVHWIRKFPFFCSDREYTIGRRIWESGRSYYCVTKGVPCSAVPRRNKPRRVDLYYSSWCIRAAESLRDGQLTATEVILFHHEDMGIPWEIAKLGVRQGMWGAVKKIEPGLRAYQKERASGSPISRSAFMAQINTKVSPKYLNSSENSSNISLDAEDSAKTQVNKSIPKLVIIGGALVVACSLDRGLLTKAVLFGVARRFARIGKKV